jgi:hypothetical protein
MKGSPLNALETIPAGLQVASLYEECGTFLGGYKQEGSYAITVLYEGVPTCVLGFPRPEVIDVRRLNIPSTVAIRLRRDFLELAVCPPSLWKTEKIHNVESLTLQRASPGLSDCVDEAGSFGGFIKNGSSVFGLICAHCLPGAEIGATICSPSALEVTGRLEHLLRYTSLAKSADLLHMNSKKDGEALGLMSTYSGREMEHGLEVL